jgi:hypothetical protein
MNCIVTPFLNSTNSPKILFIILEASSPKGLHAFLEGLFYNDREIKILFKKGGY